MAHDHHSASGITTYAIGRVAVIGPDGRWLPVAKDHYRH